MNSSTMILRNAKVFINQEFVERHSVIVKCGRIDQVMPDDQFDSCELSESKQNLTSANIIDLSDQYLLPGFIDLQVNGGGGVLFNNDPTVETLKTMADAHRQFGTTGFMPTLISDDFSVMEQAIKAVDQAIKQGVPGVLGIHLEGPFLNAQKKGVHSANKIRDLDSHGVDLLSSLRHGKTIVTIAPELNEHHLISELVDRGIIVCAGHSNASYEQLLESIEAGVSGITHLFNAMTQLGSREPGIVGAALTDDRLWFGIIADGYHLHDASLKVALKTKTSGGAILVTDAMATVGSKKNSFVLNDKTIQADNGRCTNSAGTLAGSALDMNSALINAINRGGVNLEQAVAMASINPAKALGLADQYGKIASGYAANFLALNEHYKVSSVWQNGERC